MIIAARAIALLCLCLLPLAQSRAAESSGAKFNEEVLRQEKIYRAEGEKPVEGYTVDRSLAVYTDGLASGFARALADLGPNDRWLDIGAGRGQAILDYYSPEYDLANPEGRERRGKKARAVAMSIEDRRTALWRQTAAKLERNQLTYLLDRRLREYSAKELGTFQLITDVIGGFSYTENLTLFMERMLGVLEVNGSFFSVLQDVHREAGDNKPFYEGASYLTEIIDAAGAEVKVCAWLKRISCVEVACEPKAHWQPPMESFRVRKVCEAVQVPALTLLHYQAGTPPERRFQLKNGLPQ